MAYNWVVEHQRQVEASTLTEAQLAVAVHDPLSQVNVSVLELSVFGPEPCAENGLAVSLQGEVDVLSTLGEVWKR